MKGALVHPLKVQTSVHDCNANPITPYIIVEEIEERYQFLEDMEKLGKGGAYRNQIKSEIAQRMSILKRLTKEDGQQITQ